MTGIRTQALEIASLEQNWAILLSQLTLAVNQFCTVHYVSIIEQEALSKPTTGELREEGVSLLTAGDDVDELWIHLYGS